MATIWGFKKQYYCHYERLDNQQNANMGISVAVV